MLVVVVDDSGRRDNNRIHNTVLLNRVLEARQINNEIFGPNQLYLRILGTHPDYRRRGFGSKLLKLGIDRATHDDVVITLMSTLLGYPAYIACGFRELESMRIQVKDEEVFIVMKRMVYTPGKEMVASINQ